MKNSLAAREANARKDKRGELLTIDKVHIDALNEIVESLPIACTHFDAYRFFTPDALPLNTVRPLPTRASQPQLEQPGCVHAAMDLFRYAVKLWPYLPSELLAGTGGARRKSAKVRESPR